MRLTTFLLAWLLASGGASIAEAQAAPPSLTSISMERIEGGPLDPATLKGHVVLVVNVASYCSFTPQYLELQRLWDQYSDRGLVVLGVPCNQFGGQEPGSDAEIKNFCGSMYGVTFPLLRKQHVRGDGRSPLYDFLVSSGAGGGKDVSWNFEKFLVGRDGTVIGRFGSSVAPTDPRLLAAIELALSRPS